MAWPRPGGESGRGGGTVIKEGLQEGEESPLTGESLESLGPVSQSVKGKIPQSGHILIH